MDYKVEVLDSDDARGVRLGIRCDKCDKIVRVVGLPVYLVSMSDKDKSRYLLIQGLMCPRPDPVHTAICKGREATP